MIKFQAFSPFLRQMRDGGWRITFDCDEQQYDIIKELPKLEGKILIITVEEKV